MKSMDKQSFHKKIDKWIHTDTYLHRLFTDYVKHTALTFLLTLCGIIVLLVHPLNTYITACTADLFFFAAFIIFFIRLIKSLPEIKTVCTCFLECRTIKGTITLYACKKYPALTKLKKVLSIVSRITSVLPEKLHTPELEDIVYSYTVYLIKRCIIFLVFAVLYYVLFTCSRLMLIQHFSGMSVFQLYLKPVLH